MKKNLLLFLCLIVCQCNSCGHSKPPSVEPSDYRASYYVRRHNADTVIVFVHGVFGGPTGTWTNSNSGAYWPQLLVDDPSFQGNDIYVYAYSSPYLGQSYTIDELIENMRLIFGNDEVFEKHSRVVFLCHSMGGLVVRGFLKRYQDKAVRVPLIYFFSTPTAGAHIANLARLLTKNPQLRGMLPANSEDYVSNLQRDWRAMSVHVNSRCAYEKLDTYGIRIVDEQSAAALCDGPVDPIDANHIDIVKPKDKNALPYIAFRQSFLDISKISSPPPETTVSGTVQTARSVSVDCGQARDAVASIPPPIEIKPQQKIIEAIASLQEASNLKEQLVEAKGLVNQMAQVHYRVVGLDRPANGECPGKGFAIILVTFIVSQPAEMVTTGLTPIGASDLFVALSSKSGTLHIKNYDAVWSIDAAPIRSYTLINRGDVFIKGAGEKRGGWAVPESEVRPRASTPEDRGKTFQHERAAPGRSTLPPVTRVAPTRPDS